MSVTEFTFKTRSQLITMVQDLRDERDRSIKRAQEQTQPKTITRFECPELVSVYSATKTVFLDAPPWSREMDIGNFLTCKEAFALGSYIKVTKRNCLKVGDDYYPVPRSVDHTIKLGRTEP